MQIAITGISGFVGQNLSKYLKNIFEIKAITRLQFQNINVRNLDDLSVVIHLAGKAHDLKQAVNPDDYYYVNFELTKCLFNAFIESDATKFIFISSVKAVANSVDVPITEEYSAIPETCYGKSKLMAETYLLNQQLPNNKVLYILRPSMIHGPGNKGNLNLLYQLISKRIPWPLGAFKNQRSFCSIDNVCYVIQQLLEREDIPSGIYNLADDEPVSTNELIQLIAATTHKKVKIFGVPKKIIYATARLGDIFRLPLNTERLDKLTENFVVSNNKIKAALQIEKLPVSAKEGLVKTLQSFI